MMTTYWKDQPSNDVIPHAYRTDVTDIENIPPPLPTTIPTHVSPNMLLSISTIPFHAQLVGHIHSDRTLK